MTEWAKPLRAAIDADGGPIVRFMLRALETSDGINEVLALFDGPQENVARRVAGCSAATVASGSNSPR
jgi:hypothetical protein